MPELTSEDREIIALLRSQWADQLNDAVSPLRKDLNAVMHRSSRPPGSTLEHTSLVPSVLLSRQLNDDTSFQHWLKSNKTYTSGFATELKMPPLQRKTIANISPTEHVGPIWGAPAFPLRLVSLLPTIPVTSGNVEYLEETTFTPGAAVVPETTLKPTSVAAYTERLAKVSTIASILKVSVQALMDIPQLSFWLDQRLLYAVLLKQEDAVLNGDATNSIAGLMTVAPAFAPAPVTGDTSMDLVAKAAGDLMGRGYVPDGLVLSAADYTSMRLLKTTVGSYIFVGTAATGPDDENLWENPALVWTLPTVISPSMPPGSFLIGSFRMATVLFQREIANVQIAYQNEDDFVRNLCTIRANLRSGVAVPLPAGLLKGRSPRRLELQRRESAVSQ